MLATKVSREFSKTVPQIQIEPKKIKCDFLGILRSEQSVSHIFPFYIMPIKPNEIYGIRETLPLTPICVTEMVRQCSFCPEFVVVFVFVCSI